jgi:hypothetical protein
MPRQKSSLQHVSAEEPADAIPTPRGKRRRTWEREQRADPELTQVTYRGIPRELNAQLKALARAERVTVSEVARFFLEYALAQYHAGNLDIPTRPEAVRMTVDFGAKSDVAE